MTQSIKKAWNIVSSVLVALVVILALLLVGARLVGLQVFTVLSGSMEPTYHTGSLIYVKKVDPYTIAEGTPITFMLDEDTIATHRVVGIVRDEDDPTVIRFRTKGDANEAEDGSLVHYKNVIGTPVFSVPYLGYVADYIQHPPGMYIAISAGALLLLLVFIPDIFADDDKSKKAGGQKKGKKALSRGDECSDPNETAKAELLAEEELHEADAKTEEEPLASDENPEVRDRAELLNGEEAARQ